MAINYYNRVDLDRLCRVRDIKKTGVDNFQVIDFLKRPMPETIKWQKERSLDRAETK
ncbi:hypothetical protein [Methylocucumis oryzae]|uniref:hypothetical protein n=1 Tax=Methylocucumis oryzae TaxID=1632867 RepID=UPI0012FEFDA1|nr:hypothetical protein [Methylocucumis oryzae]